MIGGLEIADTALRFVVWDGKTFQMTGLKLLPGVVVGGQLKDKERFIAALKMLHAQILGEKKHRTKINAIISLSSIGVYTQVFTLPFIEGESLEKAVQLNIQMISPLDFSEAYSGWQFANKDEDKVRLEILSAFANKGVVDEFSGALHVAGFLVVAVESRALSLSRLLKEAGAGFDPTRSEVVMSVDGSGLDFLIIRHGQLHFDYFNSWHDIQGESKEISPDAFRAAVIRNLHQVLNFYNSHWQEPLDEIILATTGFHDEVVKIIQENFSIKIRDFELNTSQTVAPDWFVALGSAVRGLIPRRSDKEISLLGVDAQEEFGREQVLGFLRFWQVLMPAAAAIFMIAFAGVYFSLSNIDENLEADVASVNRGEQAQEMRGIESQISEFNRAVTLLSSVEKAATLKTILLQKISDFSGRTGVMISRIYYQSANSPIMISGSARSPDDLLAFKKLLEGEPTVKNIELPPSSVQVSPQGAVFSMSFSEAQASPR
ncbi:MAG: Uncharacterized protein LiPW15_9 [Parcubacteria group bacterium LiPW_15]|nr:MAG: Uncharacterized protein LiPW15_9 [Parcubacteria group bacterium LiPW_15]